MRRARVLGIAAVGVLLAAAAAAQVPPQDDPLRRLSDYVAVDTTNPPGNESRGADFFAAIFRQERIEYQTAESAPGRGNIWARIPGGDAPGLVLLHHIDVVPATPEAWQTDPFQPVEKEGFLHGRGTLDTKSLGIMHLEAFLALQRSDATLARDVIFLATADEEAGGLFGAGWMVEHHPELFRKVGFLLNEGGAGVRSDGRVSYGIEVAQKVPVWLRLVARDRPGHGSMPQASSAPRRLVAALARIEAKPFPPRVLPAVRTMFEGLAEVSDPPWRDAYRDLDRAIQDPEFMARLQKERPHHHALLRNTCSLTVLSGSAKINVVPPEASAELDCRVLPDQDVDAFVAAIRERVADDAVEVEKILSFTAATSSPDTDLFRVLREVSIAHHPEARVGPTVAAGFTDSHFFRDLGITAYGYAPSIIPESDFPRVHGNDERISIDSFREGVRMMTEIVARFASQE